MKSVTITTVQELRLDFMKNLCKCQTVYDVAAACYGTLLDTFGKDNNMDFISDISAIADEENLHDAAEKYQKFRNNVLYFINMIEVSRYTEGIEIDGFLQKLKDELNGFEHPKDIDEKKDLAFCAFYIIEAIDTYVEKYVVPRRETLRSFGPLNENVCCEKCAVYFQERESILSDAYNEERRGESFRKPLHEKWIGNIFRELLIIKVDRFSAGTPKIMPVGITPECRDELFETRRLRIADIPFIGFDTFNFYEVDRKRICEHGESPHGRFSVKYYADDKENIERILILLERAIKDKANIIVFPEFILSREMLRAVKEKLAQISILEKRHLIMVFAGTGCELEHDDKEAHNILHVLSPEGYEIGQYYKYSPFNIQNNEQFHGGTFSEKNELDTVKQTLKNKDPYLKNCELLSDPGKECYLFDIDIVGRILPAICRDVIDGKYTDNLVKLFLPTLLLVSAWSASISGFDAWFSEYAITVHTSSLLCNCCNAVKQSSNLIGRFVYPIKKDTAMRSKSLHIRRLKKCHDGCPENRGCVRLIDVNFSGGKLQVKQSKCFISEQMTYNNIKTENQR